MFWRCRQFFALGSAACRTQQLQPRPRTFRRLLVQLPDPALAFGPGDVAEHLLVSDRTARSWLQEWQQAGLIAAHKPGAKRVHAWLLGPAVLRVLRPKRPAG